MLKKKKKTVFFFKFSEPLPISIDPFCFSTNRKFLNMLERASVYFDRSKLIFDRSKFFQNVLLKSLSVSINQGYFSIDRNSWNMFFKKVRLSFSNGLFQKFFNLSSLSDLAKAPPKIFCRFLPKILQGFCLPSPVSPFCPTFCILFHDFMHFSCIFIGYFRHFSYFGVVDDSNLFW